MTAVPPAVPVAAAFTERTGVVDAYDDHIGAGTVVDDADGTRWYLHCTRIADGTRTIAVETPVTFRIAPQPTGLEAIEVSPR